MTDWRLVTAAGGRMDRPEMPDVLRPREEREPIDDAGVARLEALQAEWSRGGGVGGGS